jgi:hypothetical protein
MNCLPLAHEHAHPFPKYLPTFLSICSAPSSADQALFLEQVAHHSMATVKIRRVRRLKLLTSHV